MTQRCFIALELPQPLMQPLMRALLGFSGIKGVNWTAGHNLHLTLLFLGDVPVERIPEVAEIVEELSNTWQPISMAARGIELFPSSHPRLIWINLEAQSQEIFAMHKELIKRIRPIVPDIDTKALKLHITLGRIKRPLPVQIERRLMETPVDTQVYEYDTINLYRSQLRPQGPHYSIIKQSILQ